MFAAHDICRAPQLCARTKYIRCTLGVVGVLPLWGSWVMQASILGDAAIQGSYRKMVAWVRMTVSPDAKSIGLPWDMEQAVMGLPLMPFWLKIKIVAVASAQPFISFFPPTTLGEQSLCYCRHAVSICYTKPTTGLSHPGGGNSL